MNILYMNGIEFSTDRIF